LKQPKWASWIEAIGGTAFGFVIAIPTQYFVNWWWSLPVHTGDTFAIVGLFTAVSVLRGYVWRRLCVNLGIKRTLSPFMQAVIAERFRQIEGEGWSIEHDDAHEPGDLAKAGAAYLYAASVVDRSFRDKLRNPAFKAHSAAGLVIRSLWPWSWDWWKPDVDDRRHDLIRGCALGLAEGEKFDRQRKRPATVEG
jgi:hypothetical protein